VKVDYRTTYSENSGSTVTDQIKTINTELLAGKGADLYILDGLPAASYIEKGALADISDVIEPLREKGVILNNVVNCYKNEDAIYMAPINFVMPIAFGTKDAVKSTGSIRALADYAKNKAKVSLFGENMETYSSLTTKLFWMYSDEFLSNKLEINKEGLIQFLEALKVICNQTKVMEDTTKSDGMNGDFDEATTEAMSIYDGLAELGFDYLFSEFYYYAPVSAMKKIKGNYTAINSQFFPVGMIGVNNASNQKELVYEFIKELYSEEVQSAVIDQGFPVNVKALEKFGMKPNDYYIGGPNNFEATQPSKEKMQELITLAKTLNNPIERDKVLPNVGAVEQNNELLNMILVEVLPYLKDQADAASTADKIMNKASTYFAE
jgi:ABC-type glycerol-3-phosphate transport system substrate-binding protein